MSPAATFETLCCAPYPSASLARLPEAALVELLHYLAAGGINSGVPGIIAGLAEREAAKRWLEDKSPAGAVGEG